LTARATGRHSHILFSLLAVLLPKARLSLSHATSQPQLFCHSSVSISVHIKSTHSLSIPAHPFCFILRLLVKQRTVFTHLTLLPSRHPSSGTLTKHTPGTPTSLKLGPARGFFPPRSASSLSTIVRVRKTIVKQSSLGLHKRTCQPAGILSIEVFGFCCLHSLGPLCHYYLSVSQQDGVSRGREWNGKRSSLAPSMIMRCVMSCTLIAPTLPA
jgi:hypothetical protein